MDWKVKASLMAGAGLLAGLYLGYRLARRGTQRLVGRLAFRSTPLGQYVLAHNQEHPVLQQLREMSVAHRKGDMTTATQSGKLLTLLCRTLQAEKVIDVGVFTGCSSFAMALGLPEEGGKVVACDVSKEFTDLGQPYWEQGGVSRRIELHIRPAAETLQELIDNGEEGSFDLIFIDADKPNYPTYFELGMKLLRVGGMFVVDNALWRGMVADPGVKDENTQAIRRINELMRNDPRVDFVLTTVGDGTSIGQKLS